MPRAEPPAGRPGGLRIAVCIVGQLARLEIDSKVANVLKPTWEQEEKPEALDVFLALERGGYFFSNIDNGAIHAQQHAACRAELPKPEVRRRFAPWFAAADYSEHVTRDVNLSLWKRYRRERPAEERNTRLQHHLSQFAHMRTCAQLVQASEVASRRHYDLILKMRDNTVAVSPLALSSRHLTGRCWSKNCIEWKGYNDKVMLIPRIHMDGALRDIAEDFFLTPRMGRGVPNSERLLKKVLDSHRVQVTRVTAEQLPLVDGRCTSRGWCLVEEGKDCRPATWTWPSRPCEELEMTAGQKCLYDNRFLPRRVVAKKCGGASQGIGMNEA